MTRKLDRVPELSLKAFTHGTPRDREDFTRALREGFQYFGFIILKDHAVSRDLLRRAYAQSKAFFDLTADEKRAYARGVDGQRGYTPFGKEHAKTSKVGDLKEFWHVGREFPPGSPLADLYPPNVWPEHPPEFRATFLALYDALEDAGFGMLEALAPSLDVPDDYFRKMATNGNSILRLLHYPPIPPDADPNAVRAAAHEDINLITILVAAEGGGLELLDRDGQWLAVDTDPDNLIVDAGDMLARATNDVIPATTHRVVNPKGPNVSRYSMPFFMHPHSAAVLECIPSCKGSGAKYPPITADAFLKQRLKEIGLAG
ncbi:MAG: 2-oxoglutarate and iron-dependent oxygenase domain-containing protein [Parvularculaceae bacterium]|nr:2-oxoglutarate and iron-dependent oxygenase domain-containing protein [Parvularculaceae bacterium]